ncbi:MAG: Ada metal-binding domain-containing protein [Pyrinomonadaceae bacterium]
MNILAKKAWLAAATEADARWASVAARDSQADSKFYYSVETTGVYCRPSCAARLARPENVRFHATCAEAETAGFRPCKRCQPNQNSPAEQQTAKIAEACRLIDVSEEVPHLQQLAKHMWH